MATGCKNKIEKKTLRRIVAAGELLVLIIILVVIPLLFLATYPEFRSHFTSVEAFQNFLDRYQNQSILIYLLCQIIQVVVAVLPGQVIQIAGGYMFGFALAVLLSLIGVAIGTTVSFYIARLVGRKPLSVIFGEERFEKYSHIINSKKSHFIIFILYMIPGVPKDILPYAAGVSKMRFLSLLIISLVGRFPAMICSLLMGNFMMNKNYIGMVAVAVFVAVILLLCFIKRNSLNRFMDKYYNTLNDKERSHCKAKK